MAELVGGGGDGDGGLRFLGRHKQQQPLKTERLLECDEESSLSATPRGCCITSSEKKISSRFFIPFSVLRKKILLLNSHFRNGGKFF